MKIARITSVRGDKTKGIECATECDMKVLRSAYNAWVKGGEFRRVRSRNKAFAYGRQWEDVVVNEHGVALTEYEHLQNRGCRPVTNNLIRQMVKSVVGRYRTKQMQENAEKSAENRQNTMMLHELDSRALEKFLISGCAVQRVDYDVEIFNVAKRVDNVNLNKFFINNITDCRGWDGEILGQLHDLNLSELIKRVSRGNREHAEWVKRLYSADVDGRTADLSANFGSDTQKYNDFWRSSNGKCRAIEVWTLESVEVLICHDTKKGELLILPYSSAEAQTLKDKPWVKSEWDIANVWRCRWFSPMGDLLCSYYSPYRHGGHPYVYKMYPLIDGEIHSLVEDVIDQQKYVNRLITMLEHMMSMSAKGVLLFPVDAVPEGFTWRDIRKVWASADGVLPYSERDCDAKPEQIVGRPNDLGAYDMINLQMKLFEYVSGVNGSLQGRHQTGQNSSGLYNSEVENGEIAISDLLSAFSTFVGERNRMLQLL